MYKKTGLMEQKKKPRRVKKTVSFTIDEALLKKAKAKADEEGRNMSNYLSYLIKRDLEI